MRVLLSIERLWHDIRYGFRVLAGNPGFTLVAVLSLGVGIGANVAAFSWADALLLRPLPVVEPSEVVTVGTTTTVQGFSSLNASYREYVDLRDRAKSFSSLVAYTGTTAGVATEPDALPRLTLGQLVSGNFFPAMGIVPELGRAFRPEENEVPGRDAVVVLGHDFWVQELGADRSALGHRIRINGVEFTVVGVAPASFTGMDQYTRNDFYVPLMMWPQIVVNRDTNPLEARDFRGLTIKGRLAPEATLAEAQSEVEVIGADLARAYPETNRDRVWAVRTELQTRILQSPPDAMLVAMLSTLALAVLLVACANVAGLLTSRAPARAREIALRLAIGAGRAQLVRQLITESLLIAVGGGAVGLALGYAGIRVFQGIQVPTDLPVALGFQLDRRALVFSLIIAGASALLFGLLPAIQTTRLDLTTAMKTGGADLAAPRRRWGRRILVGGQVAVSVVLLVLALFMYRGFVHQLGVGPGYRTDHLMTMGFDPSLVHYDDTETRRFYEQLADRARELPGVRSVTLASNVPMSNTGTPIAAFVPEGYELPTGQTSITALAARVDEQYFDTMHIPIVGGRPFRRQDDEGAPMVAIVNEHLAQKYWKDEDPIGKRFQLVGRPDKPWVEIVGVAKDAKYMFLAEPPLDFLYLPYRQHPIRGMVLMAESTGNPAELASPLREIVGRLDRNQPIFDVRTMEEFFRMRAISVFNVIIATVAAMGLMGLGLAIVGVYGLMSYATTRRTREIGIRMAIGADRPSVLRMVLGQGAVLAGVGLVVGLAGGIGAQQALQAMFPGGLDSGGGVDPVSLLIVGPLVLLITLLAAYLPARRASLVDPIRALRYE